MLPVGSLEYYVWEVGVVGDACRESHVLPSMSTLLWLVDMCVLSARFVLFMHMLHMEPEKFDQYHLGHVKHKYRVNVWLPSIKKFKSFRSQTATSMFYIYSMY